MIHSFAKETFQSASIELLLFVPPGTTSKDQINSPSNAAVNLASDQRAVIGGFTVVPYRAQSDSSILVQAPSHNQAGPGIGSSGSYVLGPVVQAPAVAPFVQMAPASSSLSSAVPVAGYSVASGYMPTQAGYDAISTQPEDAPSGVPGNALDAYFSWLTCHSESQWPCNDNYQILL